MEKIGRNHPCPCGSGKKYKNCCLSNPKETSREKLIDPYFRLLSTKGIPVVSGMQDVPKEIEYLPVEDQTDQKDLLDRYFKNPSLRVSPKLDELRLIRIKKRCEQWLLYKPKAFFPQLMPLDKYNNLYSQSPRIACSIYWNEIDQYVFYFRIKIINKIRDTIIRLLKLDNDYATIFFLTRQILELTYHAISYQWILSRAYNVISLPDTFEPVING
jgi:hypothetical protein